MKSIRYIQKNPDLAVAILFAAVTTGAAPFNPAAMLASVNMPLLMLLFCLMSIVTGISQSGLLTCAYRLIFKAQTSSRSLGRFFIFSSFFSSMLITNDVALIIFVPLAILTLTQARATRFMIPVITWQTIAANMGSMLTPIGNPQNLYIYSYYNLTLSNFLQITLPTTALSGLIIYLATCRIQNRTIQLPTVQHTALPWRRIGILLGLFLLCLLNVLRVLPIEWLTLLVIPSILLLDRKLFLAVDYKLLLLFVFLFIGVGNLARLPFMQNWPTTMLAGNEFLTSLLLSQFLSNVPTTVMLAQYTQDFSALLLGVNIGGLGTIIASMASIISFKAYIGTRHSHTQRYLSIFTLVNLGLLATLLACHWLFQLCLTHYYQ